ncbi:hypothetical protein [Frigidibacter sp. ROC022]|uniref:hypothetical protein n=1 Tax=Frigidibacter sp. ROC022 TaxID=2971796 RepID=UPI00215B5562|nr:hypothetical protein [Frigidibacter sp. ROC022]MCR8725247.1 hypothetical protein [Frigidibacter sp. ROC022]
MTWAYRDRGGFTTGSAFVNPPAFWHRRFGLIWRHNPAGFGPNGASLTVTNTLATILGLMIIGFLLLDHFVLHLDAAVFLFRKLGELTTWMAFWHQGI